MAPGRRAELLLAAGAVLGLALAAVAILEPVPGTRAALPEGVVAVVDGIEIREADFEFWLGRIAAERRESLEAADRAHLLDRLIDEELLVQRARALGLERHDRRVRSLMVQAMIQLIRGEAEAVEPSDEDVAAFYEQNKRFFARTPRVRLREVRIEVKNGRREAPAREAARAAAARLRRGEEIEVVTRELGDVPVTPLPDALVPAAEVRKYLGPTPARQALELETGEVSDPVRGGSAYHVLQMVERETPEVPPLQSIESQVRAELRRRAGDRALRSYLDDLRKGAQIRVVDP